MFSLFASTLIVSLCFIAGNATNTLDDQIQVLDWNGKPITSYTVWRYAEEKFLRLKAPSEVDYWYVTPIMDCVDVYDDGRMMIFTSKIVPRTTLTITAVLFGRNLTLPFDIEVKECAYGSFTKLSGQMRVTLYHQGEQVFDGRVDNSLVCIPHGTIQYKLNSFDSNQFYVADESGVTFFVRNFYGFNTTYEGAFRNVLDDPVEFNFPSFITVTPGVEKYFLMPLEGPVSRIVYDPPIEGGGYFISILRNEPGVTQQKLIVTTNGKNKTFSFDVYAGSCPEGKTLIRLGNKGGAAFSLKDSFHNQMNTGLQPYCMDDNDVFDVVVYTSNYASLFVFNGDNLFYEKGIQSSLQLQYIPVTLAYLLSFSSQLAFATGAPASQWATPDFNEKGWKHASEGSWGSFDASKTAAFRGHFAVDNVYVISTFSLYLRGEGHAEVFINGNAFSSAELGDAFVVLTLPSSFCRTGNNVVAVKLTQGASSTIRFGLALQINLSSELPLANGVASAIQEHPDPKYPPENAFKVMNCGDSGWMITSFPAELIYTFNNTQQVVNKVSMQLSSNEASVEMVGMTGDERVTLLFVNGTLRNQLLGGITFSNTRAFHSIHLIFRSTETEPVKVRCVLLTSVPKFTCAKKYGISNAVEGSSFHRRCPLFSTGRKIVTCSRDKYEPYWKETNQCYTKNPEKGYEFVDWTFTIRGIELSDWYRKMGAMTQVLVDNTYLRAGDVRYLFADFKVDNGVSVMTAFSRCEVDTAFGEVIQRNFKKLTPRFNELVKSKLGGSIQSAAIDKVVLRHYVNWVLVITVSVVVLIVVLLLSVYLVSRMKKRQMKSLRRKRSGENKALLE